MRINMLSSPEVAEKVNALMLEIGAKLNASIADVENSCPEEEFVNYHRVVGKIMGAMLLDIMNPIYAAHPALKPSQLE
jgi:hypothetical protein